MTYALTPLDQVRLDLALDWHVRLEGEEATAEDWLSFMAWLEADSRNRLVFDDVDALAGEAAVAATAMRRPSTRRNASMSMALAAACWLRAPASRALTLRQA